MCGFVVLAFCRAWGYLNEAIRRVVCSLGAHVYIAHCGWTGGCPIQQGQACAWPEGWACAPPAYKFTSLTSLRVDKLSIESPKFNTACFVPAPSAYPIRIIKFVFNWFHCRICNNANANMIHANLNSSINSIILHLFITAHHSPISSHLHWSIPVTLS